MSTGDRPQGLPEAPYGHQLADCDPLHLTVTPGAGPTLKGSDVARHAGLTVIEEHRPNKVLPEAGELAGVMISTSFVVNVTIEGRSWPRGTKIIAPKPRALPFTDGDSVRMTSQGGRDGSPARVTLWPYVLLRTPEHSSR